MLRVSSERIAALLGLYEGPRALTDQMWLDNKNVLAARLILNNIAEQSVDNIIGSHISRYQSYNSAQARTIP